MKCIRAFALLGKRVLGTSAMILLAAAMATLAAAESEEYGTELQNYFSNANTTGGQAYVNIIAPLEVDPTATTPYAVEGETCAMIYVFNTEQAMQACCGCPLTPDQLLTLSVTTQLANNPVALGTLVHDGSIRILSSYPNAVPGYPPGPDVFCDTNTGVCCDPTASRSGFTLTLGSELVAWGDHIQNTAITETVFQADVPTAAELTDEGLEDGLPQACAAILHLGSSQGVCTCSFGDPSVSGPPPRPTATATATATVTGTATQTATATATASPTPTATATATPTATPTATTTATVTATETATPTATPTCSAGDTYCPANPPYSGAGCYDLQTAEYNCGTCGTNCLTTDDGTCVNGSCCGPLGGTPPVYEVCGGVCTFTYADDNNCGGCGNICTGGTYCFFGTCTTPP